MAAIKDQALACMLGHAQQFKFPEESVDSARLIGRPL